MKFFWYHVWLRGGRYIFFATSGFIFNENDEKEKKKKNVRELFEKGEKNGGLNNLIQEMRLDKNLKKN